MLRSRREIDWTWLLTTLERQESNFNRRMDKQDDLIEKTLAQARLTNGRVTTLESVRQVDVELHAAAVRRAVSSTAARRFRIAAGVALISGALGTLVGEAAHHLFG